MKLPIAYYTDPVLRKKAERVNHIDDELRQFVQDMIETMRSVNGIGLAAPQVHRSIALFITFVSKRGPDGKMIPAKERVFINPKIVSQGEEAQTFSEGCLSIPKIYVNVTRPTSIKIQATDLDGNSFEEEFVGFEATNFMHEYDHLEGVLIVDHMSVEEREALKNLFQDSLERF